MIGMRKKYFSFVVCIFIVSLLTMACSSKGNSSGDNTSLDSTSMELPLPNVPKNLVTPTDRAQYILLHFWDKMNFRDTIRSHDKEFMERNFVNFLSLFPHANFEDLSPAVKNLLQQSFKDQQSFDIIEDLAEKYLFDAGSPMRGENYYIIFLEETLKLPHLQKDKRLRPESQLKTVMKNRPGSKATNFTYLTREGKRSTLYNTKANMLMLVFYDPECSHCTDILKSLDESIIINEVIELGDLSVLAVYTEGKRDVWDSTKASMPKNWTVAIDESSIVDKGLYDLPAMPIIYLLDSDKNVLLKDPTEETLESYLLQGISL